MKLGFRRFGVLAALMLAAAASGCANSDLFDSNEHWFSKPFSVVSRNGGYTYSELKETNTERPITAADLVNAGGACPPPPAAAPAPAPVPASPDAGMPPAAAPSLLGEGVALGMSECDVVYRAGAPASVQLGSNPNGDRMAVLTFNNGPRPGIYRFERGRLAEMDGVALPPPAEPKVVKRKKKRTAKPQQVSTE